CPVVLRRRMRCGISRASREISHRHRLCVFPSTAMPVRRASAEAELLSSGDQRNQAALIQSLRHPEAYRDDATQDIGQETYISDALLTGRYAYKIKKAVNLGFLDYRTPDARRHFCEEELRLNRRLAPEIYLDVVPIAGPTGSAIVGGPGAPIEYAVKML